MEVSPKEKSTSYHKKLIQDLKNPLEAADKIVGWVQRSGTQH
ncbi:MAG: hypothetical protein VKL60_13670 [Sphaerospermopsis sp.]|nr:hypothetical protein [Sphaerospermopsis sp.]